MESFEKEGFSAGGMAALTPALIGIGITAFVFLLLTVVGAKTFSIMETDINGSSIADTAVVASVNNSVVATFGTIEQTTDLLPLVALVVIVGILILLFSGVAVAGSTMGGGSAL